MIEYTVKVFDSGNKYWYLNGKRHREDGPAVEYTSGIKEWYLNGKRHREDGPAIEWPNGSKEWYLKGKLHREDGPAVEWPNGTKEWYLNDEELSEAQHEEAMNPEPICTGKEVEIDGVTYILREKTNEVY